MDGMGIKNLNPMRMRMGMGMGMGMGIGIEIINGDKDGE